MSERDFKIHVAKVQLNECRARRHSRVNRHFYWTLFFGAQRCRREASALSRPPQQGGLFT